MRILNKTHIEDLIFLDIETATVVEDLEIDSLLFDSWKYKKRNNDLSNIELQESYKKEAALFPEYSKVVCITVGRFKEGKIKLKSYYHDSEQELLKEFCKDLTTVYNNNNNVDICGWAIKGFDLPYLMKRCIINGVRLPELLDSSGLKPWELTSVDLADVWKSSAFKASSLVSVATALDLPSPKSDIDGSQVSGAYYRGELDRIVKYCEEDVKAVIRVFQKFKGSEVHVDEKPLITRLFEGGRYSEEEKLELSEIVSKFTDSEKKKVKVVLDAMTSTAKGKKTKVTKKDIKEIIK